MFNFIRGNEKYIFIPSREEKSRDSSKRGVASSRDELLHAWAEGKGKKRKRKKQKNGASVFSILVTGFNPIPFQFDSLSSLTNFILNFKQDRGRV